MEIDKILFEQLSKAKGITDAFEDLDVNNDGKIDEKDKTSATDTNIKNTIINLLDSADVEDVEIEINMSFEDEITQLEADLEAEQSLQNTDKVTDNAEISAQNTQDTTYASSKQIALEQATLQAQYDRETKKYEEAQKLLDTYTQEYENYQKEIEELNAEILKDQNKQVEKQEEDMQTLTNSIINSYNQETDGDFEAYFDKQMELKGYSVFSESNLSDVSKILSGKAEDVLSNIKAQSTVVSNIKINLNSIANEIKGLNASTNVNGITSTIASSEVSNSTGTNVATSTNSTAKTELKTLDEYLEIADNMYNDLYEKCGGDTEKMKEYVTNNMQNFADIDGDGEITLIDKAIWAKALSKTSGYGLDPKKVVLTKISGGVNVATSKNTNLLDLNDVENLFKLCGNWSELGKLVVAASLKSSLNISKIAQTKNWEERLDNLAETYGTNGKLPFVTQDLKKQLTSYSEFASANPQVAQYCGVAMAYQSYVTQYNNTDWEAEAKNEYNYQLDYYQMLLTDSDTKRSYNNYMWCVKQNKGTYTGSYKDFCWATVTSFYDNFSVSGIMTQNQNTLYNNSTNASKLNCFDMNADGKIDAKDVAAFSCDIDLDGDGAVSEQEKQFLQDVKENLTAKVYSCKTDVGVNNLTNIDDLISTVTTYDEDSYVETLINKYTNSIDEHSNSEYNSSLLIGYIHAEDNLTPDTLTTSMSGNWWFSGIWRILGTKGRSIFEKFCTNEEIESNQITYARIKEVLAKALEYEKTANTYLLYIQSADLSKEELEEILSKINSAPEAAQSQLAEVKAVVQQKLSAM